MTASSDTGGASFHCPSRLARCADRAARSETSWEGDCGKTRISEQRRQQKWAGRAEVPRCSYFVLETGGCQSAEQIRFDRDGPEASATLAAERRRWRLKNRRSGRFLSDAAAAALGAAPLPARSEKGALRPLFRVRRHP
jgi:hypothetical protein